MTSSLNRFASACAFVALACTGAYVAGCGGSNTSPSTSTSVVLVDTSVTLVAGTNCTTGAPQNVDFSGTSGKTVVIAATGAVTMTPHFTLYAPDFATQLGGSTTTGAGAASLTFTLTQTGVHHVSFCDSNGVVGALHVTVTQQ